MLYPCPKAAALTAVEKTTCDFRIDQTIYIVFQRGSAGVGGYPFDATTLITAQASWDAAKAAVDDEKIVISPIVHNPQIPSSEGLTEGGNDNTTPFGLQRDMGEGSVQVTGEFRNLKPKTKKQLALLRGESSVSLGVAALRAYFINQFGYIVHEVDDVTTPTKQRGIAIYNFRVGSAGSQGFNSDNVIPFSFSMTGQWDENIAMTLPAFDMLSYLNM